MENELLGELRKANQLLRWICALAVGWTVYSVAGLIL